MTYPEVNALFTSPARGDGTQKWVDLSRPSGIWTISFKERYQKWSRKNKYNFSSGKAAQIYADAQDQIAMRPKDDLTKAIIQQSVDALTAVSQSVEQLRAEMRKLSEQLPEYPVVMAMDGVGDSHGPQLMAELGDVTRFAHRSTVTAFAGVDPGANQSGTYEATCSKCGSPELRGTLFLVMDCLLKNKPQDNPVYQFMDRKRSEGKPYLVYMTAGTNKFLRIYYGKVKEYLASLEQPPATGTHQNI